MANVAELRQLIALAKEHGIIRLKFGDIELEMGPEEVEPVDRGTQEILSTLDHGGFSGSDYDNPALYPGGVDPVAEMREWRNQQLEATSDVKKQSD
jgi:hypothetical protein